MLLVKSIFESWVVQRELNARQLFEKKLRKASLCRTVPGLHMGYVWS